MNADEARKITKKYYEKMEDSELFMTLVSEIFSKIKTYSEAGYYNMDFEITKSDSIPDLTIAFILSEYLKNFGYDSSVDKFGRVFSSVIHISWYKQNEMQTL